MPNAFCAWLDPASAAERCSRNGARRTRTPDLLGAIQAPATIECGRLPGTLAVASGPSDCVRSPQFAAVSAGFGPTRAALGPTDMSPARTPRCPSAQLWCATTITLSEPVSPTRTSSSNGAPTDRSTYVTRTCHKFFMKTTVDTLPAVRRWGDPDSNRGHHDFQSWARIS